MPDALIWAGLVLLGVAVAAYGTLIGAGGGFILTPILLLLYPGREQEVITSISLAVVTFNAASGSIAFGRQRRIDFVAASLFAAATVPGAVIGALLTGAFPRHTFEAVFGAFLLLLALWLLYPSRPRIVTSQPSGRYIRRMLTDAQGDTYVYSFDPLLGCILGLGIGFVSSLFGVGGGIIYVPALVLLLRFPAYIATATSTFILLFTAAAGSTVNLSQGHYAGVGPEVLALTIGVLIGAQLGALASARLTRHQAVILRSLSVGLIFVGLRLIAGSLL